MPFEMISYIVYAARRPFLQNGQAEQGKEEAVWICVSIVE